MGRRLLAIPAAFVICLCCACFLLRKFRVGGIMFWAVNEGARAPNGKTTGENSVALANYAAAL